MRQGNGLRERKGLMIYNRGWRRNPVSLFAIRLRKLQILANWNMGRWKTNKVVSSY